MGRTQGRGDAGRRESAPDQRPGHGERRRAADREARDWSRQTGYGPGVNQRRDEPMPASRHDDRRQEAVVRNEEHADEDNKQARPSPRAPSRQQDDAKASNDHE